MAYAEGMLYPRPMHEVWAGLRRFVPFLLTIALSMSGAGCDFAESNNEGQADAAPGAAQAGTSLSALPLDCEVTYAPVAEEVDWQKLDRFFVSPLVDITRAPAPACTSEWRSGEGLFIEGSSHCFIDFPAPLSLRPGEDTAIEVEMLDSGTRVALSYSDGFCAVESGDCKIIGRRGPEGHTIRFSLAKQLKGPASQLRLHFEVGPSVVRAARVLSTSEVADPTRFILLGPGHAPDIVSTHHLDVQRLPSGGLHLTIRGDDPYVLFRTEFTANDSGLLEVHSPDSPPQIISAYFVSDACPALKESCKATSQPSKEQWFVPMAAVGSWSGHVSRIRLDFHLPEGSAFTLAEARLQSNSAGDGESFALAGDPEEPLRGPKGLRRFFEGGPLGWRLAPGDELHCQIPAEKNLLLPQQLDIRVPPRQAGPEHFEVSAHWEQEDRDPPNTIETQQFAARIKGSFAHRIHPGWESVDLTPPSSPASRLAIRLDCGPNCRDQSRRDRVIHIAQPIAIRRADRNRRNLIMIQLDTLRADRLAGYGHSPDLAPNLSKFAAASKLYEHVYSADTWTLPGHTALLAGRLQYIAGADYYESLPDVPTLASVLRDQGYHTFANSDGVLVTPSWGLDRGFQTFDYTHEPLESKLDDFAAAIERSAAEGVPFFGFLQSYAVHEPYSLSPSEREIDEAGRTELRGVFPISSHQLQRVAKRLTDHPFKDQAAAYLLSQYDAGIRSADRLLGRFFDRLDRMGIADETVIIFVSDHGEEFLEHGSIGHGHQLAHTVLTHVPLIVRNPDASGPGRESEVISQTMVPNIALRALGFDEVFVEPCTERDAALSFSSTSAPGFPVERFLSAAVTTETCLHIEVSERRNGQIALSQAVPRESGIEDQCASEQDLAEALFSCLKDELEGNGGYGPERTDPSARDANSGKSENDSMGAFEKKQLKALGYVFD